MIGKLDSLFRLLIWACISLWICRHLSLLERPLEAYQEPYGYDGDTLFHERMVFSGACVPECQLHHLLLFPARHRRTQSCPVYREHCSNPHRILRMDFCHACHPRYQEHCVTLLSELHSYLCPRRFNRSKHWSRWGKASFQCHQLSWCRQLQ